jgi:peptidoglycan-N-acetylglucosamine deacetylase
MRIVEETSETCRQAIASLRRRVLHAAVDGAPRSLLFRRGTRKSARVALTFDDGPDELTPRYLDLLDRLGVRATFFMLGASCLRWPAHLREVVARGHEVASHGHTHRAFPALSAKELAGELASAQAALPPAGRPRPFLRPPRGALSPRSFLQCAAAGYTTVLWSLDSDDCRTESSDTIAARVGGARAGEIVLLHEGQEWTLDALPKAVASLRASGFELVTVGDLL